MRTIVRSTVMVSLALLLVECDSGGAPTAAPTTAISPTAGAAPAAEPATTRFTSYDEGYTLRFPAGYNVVVYSTSMCLTEAPDVVQACHVANALVDVAFAGGQTLAEAADAVAAQANPDIEVLRTAIAVGGEPAVQLDDIYGVDVFRKVVVIHADRVYILSFVPWSETWDGFDQLEFLYDTILSTFEFTP